MAREQHMGNARVEVQRQKMEMAKELNECTFCLDRFEYYHDAPIIKEGGYWIVTDNDYPYDNTKHHTLFILKRHAENIEELTSLEWAELRKLIQEFKKEHLISGGAIFLRFGEEKYSGGTLPHIHAHLIVPDIESGSYQPVPCYVGERR